MMLAPRGFAHDAAVRPFQSAEVHGESNARQPGRSGGTQTLANGRLVLDTERERLDRFGFGLQDFTVSRKNQMVNQPAADVGIEAGGRDGKFFGRAGPDFEEQLQSQSSGVESRPQVGGSGR